MSELANLFACNQSGPYDKSVRCTVVVEGTPVTYRGKDQCLKEVKTVAVSDGIEVLKVISYDPSTFRFLTMDNTVQLRTFIRKRDEGGRHIVLTTKSRAVFSAPLAQDVPQSHKRLGELIVSPPQAETCTIATALASPKSQKRSITGRIIQEEEVRTVKAKGEDVPIRTIVLQDDTGKATVSLWREAATIEARPGDHVFISDVTTNYYNNQTTLQTSMRSTIKKVDAPTTTEVVTVNGIAVAEQNAELSIEERVELLLVPAELLLLALQAKDDTITNVEEACVNGTFSLTVTSKGAEIISLHV